MPPPCGCVKHVAVLVPSISQQYVGSAFTLIIIVIATIVEALPTTTFIVVFFAASLAAILATLLQPQVLRIVYAITSRVFTGVIGSSLVMTSSQDLGHFSVALYRIRTLRHEPGCSVAGNGLLISFQ